MKRLEGIPGPLAAQERTIDALRTALEAAGVIFLSPGEQLRGGPGVRLHDPRAAEAIVTDDLKTLIRAYLEERSAERLISWGFEKETTVGEAVEALYRKKDT